MPRLEVTYISATSIGLFEQTAADYGEILYEMGGKNAMSRLTTADGVLETVYSLSGVPQPIVDDTAVFRGHPLAVAPTGAATIFFGVWPALVAAVAFLSLRRHA